MGKFSTQRKYWEKYFTCIHIPTPRHVKGNGRCFFGMACLPVLIQSWLKMFRLVDIERLFFISLKKTVCIYVKNIHSLMMNWRLGQEGVSSLARWSWTYHSVAHMRNTVMKSKKPQTRNHSSPGRVGFLSVTQLRCKCRTKTRRDIFFTQPVTRLPLLTDSKGKNKINLYTCCSSGHRWHLTVFRCQARHVWNLKNSIVAYWSTAVCHYSQVDWQQ